MFRVSSSWGLRGCMVFGDSTAQECDDEFYLSPVAWRCSCWWDPFGLSLGFFWGGAGGLCRAQLRNMLVPR